MWSTLDSNFRRVQLKLSLIFSLSSLLIITVYTLMIVSSQRIARHKFEKKVVHDFNSDNDIVVPPDACTPPPPVFLPANEEWSYIYHTDTSQDNQLSIKVVLQNNWPHFDHSFLSHLLLFDFITWLALTIAGYFFISWLLRPVRQASQQQEEFLANAAHELKTPITTIKAEMSLLTTLPMSRNLKESWQVINTENQTLQNLVDKLLLATSQPPAHHPSQTIDLYTLTQQLAKKYQKIYHNQHLRFVAAGPHVSLSVHTDRLQTILELLLDNAGKYSHPHTQIDINWHQESRFCQLTITNQGVGINPDQQILIWQRFYRVTDPAVQAQTGSGLGLAIAQDIAQEIGGTLTLVDGSPKHTVFALRWPIAKSPKAI